MKIEQIKKALECCEDSEKCDVCPYYGSIHCQEILIKDALGFINRQQTEIERLKTENGHFERNMKSVLEIEKENIRKETAKEFAEQLKEKIKALKVAEDENYIFKCGFEVLQDNLPEIIDELLKEHER